MLTLKVVSGAPPAGCLDSEELIALETGIVINTLTSTEGVDTDPERDQHPKDALFMLCFNGAYRYLYKGDEAYIINDTGGTVKSIWRRDQF